MLAVLAVVRGSRGGGGGAAVRRRAIIVALQCDAVAFVHGGLRRLRRGKCRGSDHGESGGERAGDRGVGECILGINSNHPFPGTVRRGVPTARTWLTPSAFQGIRRPGSMQSRGQWYWRPALPVMAQ